MDPVVALEHGWVVVRYSPYYLAKAVETHAFSRAFNLVPPLRSYPPSLPQRALQYVPPPRRQRSAAHCTHSDPAAQAPMQKRLSGRWTRTQRASSSWRGMASRPPRLYRQDTPARAHRTECTRIRHIPAKSQPVPHGTARRSESASINGCGRAPFRARSALPSATTRSASCSSTSRGAQCGACCASCAVTLRSASLPLLPPASPRRARAHTRTHAHTELHSVRVHSRALILRTGRLSKCGVVQLDEIRRLLLLSRPPAAAIVVGCTGPIGSAPS